MPGGQPGQVSTALVKTCEASITFNARRQKDGGENIDSDAIAWDGASDARHGIHLVPSVGRCNVLRGIIPSATRDIMTSCDVSNRGTCVVTLLTQRRLGSPCCLTGLDLPEEH